MKHALLLTPFAAMLLASCSNVDVETLSSNMGDPIGFLPAMGTQSRASEITNANISSIYVTSMMGDKPYFSSLKYTKGSDGYFTSSPEYYWPGDDNSTLEFYAYAPSQDEIGGDVTIDNTTKKLENFSVADSIADQVDFITNGIDTGVSVDDFPPTRSPSAMPESTPSTDVPCRAWVFTTSYMSTI